MSADITETRPDLYRALMVDGWQYKPLQGGGGVFTVDAGGERLSVQMKRGLACELRVSTILVARFTPASADRVVAAAAVAQKCELVEAAR